MTNGFFIHGADTYRSYKALKAIETRFLAKPGSFVDFVKVDMEDTSLDTLKQAFLTIPFLVTHRLFVLKNTLSAPKATLEGLTKLMSQLSASTVVVFYETKPCDKRLAFYKWLTSQCKVQEYAMPEGVMLEGFIRDLAHKDGVTIEPRASLRLSQSCAKDMWQLALEVAKLGAYVKSQDRTLISLSDVEAISYDHSEESLFKLTDALREKNIKRAVELYRFFLGKEDPILLGATIGSQMRSLAKVIICQEEGVTRPDEIARRTQLNPYVVKLTQSLARSMSVSTVKSAYSELVRFDARIKDGTVPPETGLLLLIIRLHDTLINE